MRGVIQQIIGKYPISHLLIYLEMDKFIQYDVN